MTLIAAFRCNTNRCNEDVRPGVVICADSQETAGDYRVTVDKIKPRDAGAYDLIIGGAGNVAALIDGLAYAVEQNVKRWPPGLDEESARLRVERVLLSYHARQVAYYPAEPHEKLLRFIICTRDKGTSRIFLWKTDGTTAEQVEGYALLGWEEAAYHYEAGWLYYPEIWTTQAIVLGTRLLAIAKNSLYVGGDTQVIIVRGDGMTVENPNAVREFERRINEYNRALALLALACPDVGIEPAEFRRLLGNLVEQIVSIHDRHGDEAAVTHLEEFLVNPNLQYGPYKRVPLEMMLSIVEEELRERKAERAEATPSPEIQGPGQPTNPETSEGQE